MDKKEILKKLIELRNKSYKFVGGYEENYNFFMYELDEIIGEIENG